MKLAVHDLLHARHGACSRTRGVKALFWIMAPTSLASLPLNADVVPMPYAWAIAAAIALTFLVSLAMGLGLPSALAPTIGVITGSQDLAGLGLIGPLVILAILSRRSILQRLREVDAEPTIVDLVLAQPARVLVVSFALICSLGTMLLRLPISSRSEPIDWLDAAFTSVSATCVTGLSVVDTETAVSTAGQFFILLLLQVGGLGVMVFSAASVVVLGRRLSLSHEAAAVDLVGATSRADLAQALRTIYIVTFVTEGVSGVLLTGSFWWAGDSFLVAAWRGFFT